MDRICKILIARMSILRFWLLAAALCTQGCGQSVRSKPAAEAHLLIYTKNGTGYVHDNIEASVQCLKKICARKGWTAEVSEEPSVFSPENLRRFDAVIFANTNNEAFDTDTQRQAFRQYIQKGGRFVGIHSACGSERNWPWFWANLGGKFVRHPVLQPFQIKVIDRSHPSTQHLGAVWQWEDECYFMNELNPGIHILLAADLRTIDDAGKKSYPGRVFGDYFPLCWSQTFDGGRQWYTALGHKKEHYEDPDFIQHLTGGIEWVLKDN